MALKATIFKADISITDMDRNYYNDHNLTIARHPSENDERMMLRIIAFIVNAHERLQFTKGLSDDDVPDLWQKNFSDETAKLIDLEVKTLVMGGYNRAKEILEKNRDFLY